MVRQRGSVATVAGMMLYVDGVLNQNILQLGETAMRFYIRQVVVPAVAILLATGSVRAEWIDTFDGGVFHQSWNWGSITAGGTPSGSFLPLPVGNMLQMEDSTPAAAGGAASAFGLVGEFFDDVVVGAVVNPLGESTMNREVGVLARVNPGSLNGYAFTVDYFDNSGVISLTRIDATPLGLAIVPLASSSLSSFASTDSVYLELRIMGNRFDGSAYTGIGGSLLGNLPPVDDAAYGNGLAGVVVNSQNGLAPLAPLRGTYDMVAASLVPEPSSLVILISGCLCALGLARRRRRCPS
jgi:hypothetical protein